MTGLHENLGGGVLCPNNEFPRLLAFSVWHIPEERLACLQQLSGDAANGLNTIEDFGRWLCLEREGWINLIHLVIWAWGRMNQSKLAPPPLHDARSEQSQPISVVQWCTNYQLSQAHMDILVRLGFSPGDDLKASLTDEDWHAAKVLPLEKRRLIEASEKDKKERSGRASPK
jgi:hypothetical protein